MEIFLLRPSVGQSLFIDLKRLHNNQRKALDLFSNGPVEILFCRAVDDEIVLSIKAPNELDIFVSGNDYNH
ncbi:MAG: hypothetical protein COB61_008930 [Thiotrichales bacterium]|nr:hypothetical protein [Thiotrichales bacterium]